MGCMAVKDITGEALVPIEAANRFLRWLAQHFGRSSDFASEVIGRVAGCYGIKASGSGAWPAAGDELAHALESDDSLFAVEEQNLFVDEVRETVRWVGVFESLPWDAADASLARLDDWLTQGVLQLRRLAEREDGPLGWASNPDVFAVCTRLVRGSAAMEKQQHASASLREAIANTREALQRQNTGVSRLLTEAWE